MATEHIPQIDKLIKDFGKQFSEDVRQVNKAIERLKKEINQFKEENQMTHTVTIKKTEKRVIEEYWLMRGIRIVPCTNAKEVIKECESEKEPTLEQIAQFLSDSNADFVSVEHNYRFEPDLPFC